MTALKYLSFFQMYITISSCRRAGRWELVSDLSWFRIKFSKIILLDFNPLLVHREISLKSIHSVSVVEILDRSHIIEVWQIIELFNVFLHLFLFCFAPDLLLLFDWFHSNNRSLIVLFDDPILIKLITELTIVLFLLKYLALLFQKLLWSSCFFLERLQIWHIPLILSQFLLNLLLFLFLKFSLLLDL